MIDKNKLKSTITELLENTDKFLVDLKLSTANVIRVFIDGDNNVTVDDCVKLSKGIEEQLDRETEDFELQVSSAGLDASLRHIRQYKKNIGRNLKLETMDGNQFKAKLIDVDNETLMFEHTFKQKAPNSRKKVEVVENISLKLDEIKSAKIVISF